MTTAAGHAVSGPPVVTAVVVSHDGQRWLPSLLAGLRGQRRRADRVLAVDTASRDASAELLRAELGPGAVLAADRQCGFGAAVQLVLRRLDNGRGSHPATEWVWLLHDDCAPEPSALERLLDLGGQAPSVAVVGPKVRGWPASRRLLEVGVSISGNGRRETGLERREVDQGQYDGVRDVLAVGSAGMLVRRDVWEELGGFDPALPLFRDDVDFGWRANRAGYRVLVCPDAVVHHAEATTVGRRAADAASPPSRVDRRHAYYTLLVNCSAFWLPLVYLRLALAGTLRALGHLVGKAPLAAVDEALALGAALGRVDRLARGRRARRRTNRIRAGRVRWLLPPVWLPLRHLGEAVSEALADRTGGRRAALTRTLTRPPVLALLATAVLAVVAARDLLGAGELAGGSLLPAPGGAADLWRTYTETWHPVGLGSAADAPPYVGALALLSTLLLGKAWLAVDLLVLGAVPLAMTSAYLLSRRFVGSRPVRVWAALAYGLLPVLTGAVGQGRLGALVASVLLPLTVLAAHRAVGSLPPTRGPGPWRAAWGTGALLAALTAFTPLAYPLAVVLAVVGLATVARGASRGARVLLALAVPPVLLGPWALALVQRPGLVLAEAGLVTPVRPLSDPLEVLAGRPGGAFAAPWWLSAALLAAAVVALARRDRRTVVLTAWVVALAGAAVALFVLGQRLPAESATGPVPAWPGLPALVSQGGLVAAAAAGADGARRALAGASFGWRQPLVAAVTVAAALTPVVAACWWVLRGDTGDLDRVDAPGLPAYIAEAQLGVDRPRSLVLRVGPARAVAYALVRDDGVRTGEDAVAPPATAMAGLDRVVSALVVGGRGGEVAALARYGVGYVLASTPAPPRLVDTLDTVPGLVRASAGSGAAAAWRVDLPVSRVRVLADPGSGGRAVPSHGPVRAAGLVANDGPGRVVVLAERRHPDWRAGLDGRSLASTAAGGWAQAFELPADGGRLQVTHRDSERTIWLVVQGVLVALVGVLAAPVLSRSARPEQW